MNACCWLELVTKDGHCDHGLGVVLPAKGGWEKRTGALWAVVVVMGSKVGDGGGEVRA